MTHCLECRGKYEGEGPVGICPKCEELTGMKMHIVWIPTKEEVSE